MFGLPAGVGHTSGALAANFAGTGGLPVIAGGSALVAGAWSARYSGEITMPGTGTFNFRANRTGSVRLRVDDTVVIDEWAPASGYTAYKSFICAAPCGAGTKLRIAVDYRPSASGSIIELHWSGPGAPAGVVPGANLAPRYGLVTATTTDDATPGSPAAVTAIAYAVPHVGPATTVTVDPGGLALATTTAYEAPGAGAYFRRLSRALPAQTVSTDAHYTAQCSGRCHQGQTRRAVGQ